MQETMPQEKTTAPSRIEPGRQFPCFLTAFEVFGEDNHTPPRFNTWVGLSIIAAALERKVWIQHSQSVVHYPNIYVFLVALPGVGKSTALNRGVDLLQTLALETKKIRIMPNKSSDAALVEEMVRSKNSFLYKDRIQYHCSGFFFASEASDSFAEVYGDITGTMTSLYDCNKMWKKTLKSSGESVIQNACFNMLAGTTFQFLGNLVTKQNVTGGFASRIIYVKGEKAKPSRRTFLTDFEDIDEAKQAYEMSLVNDLKRINEMVGPFSSTPEFREAWAEWDYENQVRQSEMSSEIMQSLVVRTSTLMDKLCMILSASESSDRIVRLSHFKKAKQLIIDTQEDLAGLFLAARANNTETADGLKSAFFGKLSQGKPVSREDLTASLVLAGYDVRKVQSFVQTAIENKIVRLSGGLLELLINPNDHL